MPSLRSLRWLTLLLITLFASPSFSEIGYIEYSAGVSFVPNQDLDQSSHPNTGLRGSIELDAGFVIGAAIGLTIFEVEDLGIRTEIAVDYRETEINGLTIGPGPPSDANGDFGLMTVMLNAYMDYSLEDFGVNITPYLGIGVGYGRIEISGDNSAVKFNDTDSVFAYNVMLGLTIPYSDTVDFKGGYRYVETTDPEFSSTVKTPEIGPTRFDSEFDAHELTIGMRIKF